MRRYIGWLLLAPLALASPVAAGDKTWDNGSANFTWNTTSTNWTGTAWNNAAGDGAIFGATGVGSISVPGPISVNSFNFTVDGYTLSGAGPLNIVTGTSTQTTAVANVAAGATTTISAPIVSTLGFQKIGGGTLVLSGANTITGGATAIPLAGGRLPVDVLVGPTNGSSPVGGTLRVTSQAALPATTKVGIGPGYLDIGANNITLNSLTFTNQSPSTPWNNVLNVGGAGVVGTGTLRVTGEINVLGVTGGNFGNAIAAPVNLGGGTQVVRVGVQSSFGLSGALMFTGGLSNGSLIKSLGYTQGGTIGSIDGIGLYANNTYTGSSVFNGGTNIATGTNATTSVKAVGLSTPGGSNFTLQGANGSIQSATTVLAAAGASFILDNNAALGASGNNAPNIPGAQNNDRVRDDAAVELRDGFFVYRGFTGAAATETFGSLMASGGFNTVTLTPNGGGSATVTVAGNLSLAARAALQVQATGAGNTLGGNTRLMVVGTTPTADATGIIRRMTAGTDLATYNAGTGVTPYTGYAGTYTANANVSLTAANTAPTVSINALRSSGTFTTTIGATDTLTVDSGMLVNATGTHTISGGTLNFGSSPGTIFSGATISSAVTGSQGLIVPNGTTNLSGNSTGLSGTLSVLGGTLTLTGTNLTTAPIEVRMGTLNFNTSQAGAGLGAITLGVPQNDADLFGGVPTLSFSGAGNGAIIDRPIIIDNGAMTASGLVLPFGLLARFSPLSNSTGSQTLNGNITLNSGVNLQGGGGGGTGATQFSGAVSGQGPFAIPNGRVVFTATSNITNTGGFLIGNSGSTAQVTFNGTTSGVVPLVVQGGNNIQVSYANNSLPQGPLTIQNATGSTAPSIIPLATSSINNAITLNGDVVANVGSGINATWGGPISGDRTLTKSGVGTLTLSGSSPAYTGPMVVNAGTVSVTGTMAAASSTVNTGGTLQGNGTLTAPVTVNVGGAIKGGNSIGTLTVGGNATLMAAAANPPVLRVEGDASTNSKLVLTGAGSVFNLANLTGTNQISIDLTAVTGLTAFQQYTWELVRTQDNAAGVQVNGVGSFGVIPPANYQVIGNASSVILTANPNTLVIQFTPVPEPSLLLVPAAMGVLAWRRRRGSLAVAA